MHKFMPRRCFLYLLPNKSEEEGEFLASCPMIPAFQIETMNVLVGNCWAIRLPANRGKHYDKHKN